MNTTKTDVAIIGAGPSGLMLGHLLTQAGINCIIVERKSPDYVLSRIRAGVLEQCTLQVMEKLGLDSRLKAEGLPHDGVILADGERVIEIDVKGLTGSQVVVYGQTEITKDLMDASDSRGVMRVYDADDVALHNIETEAPCVTYTKNGEPHRIDCRFIAGCDGFHGPSRKAMPGSNTNYVEKVYPFGWLGVLADVSPATHEVAYSNHDRGFALSSMRSLTRSRYYIQVGLDEKVEDWSDERFWDELAVRLGPEISSKLVTGPSIEKSIAPLRSFIFGSMRHGSLFLAGDSAHIVPPTGAKGLNLASSDITYLSAAIISYFKEKQSDGINLYSEKALNRVWKSSRFSWYLTTLMHRFPEGGEFDRKMQVAELEYIAGSKAAQTTIAENYIGLPL
ncbi:4-hydroxybenzoate 3-monooxygenase [Alteromonas sp. 1_MG-2023]|uniref:4-hydroxybenzoate 3-monooxygenase n=1 Tax=Alteromonas sp. 1_MG-2023 TaxID=3062669 RepID=UPI0026E147F6|nr:4-hydroxybenzoate 3-monooxygenase [Alteromonas sp. 1_MG-2023]MDO6477131.1 4-hydroxybenzoate 3-monooxygenase [Alteromonas sp. 1_MG-2023]